MIGSSTQSLSLSDAPFFQTVITGNEEQQRILDILKTNLETQQRQWIETETETSDCEDPIPQDYVLPVTPPPSSTPLPTSFPLPSSSSLFPSIFSAHSLSPSLIEEDDALAKDSIDSSPADDLPGAGTSSYSSNSTDAPHHTVHTVRLFAPSTSGMASSPSESELFKDAIAEISIPPSYIHLRDLKTKTITPSARAKILAKQIKPCRLEKAPFKTGQVITDSEVLKKKEGTTTTAPSPSTLDGKEYYWITSTGLKYGAEVNEDRLFCEALELNSEIIPAWGIFDGHGGEATSSNLQEYSSTVVHHFLSKVDLDDPVQIQQALKISFVALHAFIGQREYDGATALIALIIRNKLWIANAGDCRAVLSAGGKATQLSRDAIPAKRPFRDSLEKRGLIGGYVFFSGGKQIKSKTHPREMGITDVKKLESRVLDETLRSRCQPAAGIGDPQIPLSHRPKVRCLDLSTLGPETYYLILGTDGVFDALDSNEIPIIVQNSSTVESVAKNIAASVFSMGPDHCDNTSLIAIRLK